MAKKGLSVRQHRNPQQQVEARITEFDDPLPEADELAKLQAIDETIVPWLKNHVDKEQDFRHQSWRTKAEVFKRDAAAVRRINVLGMICAFIVVMVGMGFSYFLIAQGLDVMGTIFAGGVIVLAASMFLRKPKTPQQRPGQPPQ